MSDRQFFDEWIAGNFNQNFLFKPIFDRLAARDEVPELSDMSALEAHFIADESKMNAFCNQIALHSDGDFETPQEWCQWLHDELEGIHTNIAGKANSSHSHSYSSLSGLPTLFSGLYSDLTGTPSTFAPSAHTHGISDITNLQTALDDKISKSNKASAITDTAGNASADFVTILGISVPTNASYSALVSAHNSLKDKVNTVLSALRTRDIIAA